MESFKNYRTTIKYVKQFLSLDLRVAGLFLSEINMEFITNLKYYIREHPVKGWDPCLGNGLGKHIQRFKRIMNWAKSIKWIKENLVGDYPAKLKKNKRKKLSIEALVPLDNQALSDKKLIILVSANQYADILFSIIKKQCIFDSINYESAL